MEQRTLIIDGAQFDDLSGFLAQMDKLLRTDDDSKHTNSLSGLDDLLRGGFGVHHYGEKLSIIWRNAAKSRDDLGYPATAVYWQHVVERCHPSSRAVIENKLEETLHGQGLTLFDMIIDIMTDTNGSGHDCVVCLED